MYLFYSIHTAQPARIKKGGASPTRYDCSICGYVSDKAQNPPRNTLPDDWKRPIFGAAKIDFWPESAQPSTPVTSTPIPFSDLRPLFAPELSAVCSNLARDCEKQYHAEQTAAFTRLADCIMAED